VFRINAENRRFEWTENGHTAHATFQEHPGFFALPHVEAPHALRGTGAAGRLMQAIADHARASQVKLLPTCPYARAWFNRHPDQRDVLAKLT
jgi:predicted GNAT family acetyltransferase